MITRHEPLVEALTAALAAIERKDAEAAQLATETMVALITSTPSPTADERVAPLFARCQQAAEAYRAQLEGELKGNATSARASRAYVDRSQP